MSSAAVKTRLTPEQYLASERKSSVKSEYDNGFIYAMAGASRPHNLIASNLNREIGSQLKDRPCEVYISDMRVCVSQTGLYTYPDVVAVCGEPHFQDGELDTLLNPTVIVEVLSDSTEADDRGSKLAALPTVGVPPGVRARRPGQGPRGALHTARRGVAADGIPKPRGCPAARLDRLRCGPARGVCEGPVPRRSAGRCLIIVKRLGRGGMGAVYLAHDTQLDRRVALKVPHFTPEDGPEVLDRFYREARAAATFDHPNLCPVYDVGQVDGVHFLTMAYIEGQPLSEVIDPDKPLPQRQAAAVVRKLALALQEAHRRGVIHRDLKPANIMVNRRREPVIMDFGLARRDGGDDARLTRDGWSWARRRTWRRSRWPATWRRSGPACDVYSLGVILYELLTGRRPFEGPVSLVLGQIAVAEPEPPSRHRPDLDPRLEAICLKAMAKKVGDRYASMSELAAALGDYLNSGARQPRPDPSTASLRVAGDDGRACVASRARSPWSASSSSNCDWTPRRIVGPAAPDTRPGSGSTPRAAPLARAAAPGSGWPRRVPSRRCCWGPRSIGSRRTRASWSSRPWIPTSRWWSREAASG